jgi:hypothetical protein
LLSPFACWGKHMSGDSTVKNILFAKMRCSRWYVWQLYVTAPETQFFTL